MAAKMMHVPGLTTSHRPGVDAKENGSCWGSARCASIHLPVAMPQKPSPRIAIWCQASPAMARMPAPMQSHSANRTVGVAFALTAAPNGSTGLPLGAALGRMPGERSPFRGRGVPGLRGRVPTPGRPTSSTLRPEPALVWPTPTLRRGRETDSRVRANTEPARAGCPAWNVRETPTSAARARPELSRAETLRPTAMAPAPAGRFGGLLPRSSPTASPTTSLGRTESRP